MGEDSQHSTQVSPDTRYEISGFRSLIDFSIVLRPGINVLVGPNGSGKTNFIDFLDFLDKVIRNGASTAVSSAGGLARVFSIETSKRSSPALTARIEGIAEISESPREPADQPTRRIFNFEYDLEIKFARASSAIYISRENVKIRKVRSPSEDHLAHSSVGSLTVIRKSPSEEVRPARSISPRLLAENPRNPFAIKKPFLNQRTIKEMLSMSDTGLMPDESFLSPRGGTMLAIDAIRNALTRGLSFNIIPARSREPDDLSRPPHIQRDGSGLSATLHSLFVARRGGPLHRRTIQRRRFPTESLDVVIEWTKLVFPELKDIMVAQDPHSGKYLVHLVVGSEEPIRIPLQAASDGTVKWLAFVCLITAVGFAYSIEEPENFLHPRMQQFLVQLIRESPRSSLGDYFIFSSHSETLINQCKPNELLVFKFDGSTTCHRLSDPDRVQHEINETGFGLGYYYAANALS